MRRPPIDYYQDYYDDYYYYDYDYDQVDMMMRMMITVMMIVLYDDGDYDHNNNYLVQNDFTFRTKE